MKRRHSPEDDDFLLSKSKSLRLFREEPRDSIATLPQLPRYGMTSSPSALATAIILVSKSNYGICSSHPRREPSCRSIHDTKASRIYQDND